MSHSLDPDEALKKHGSKLQQTANIVTGRQRVNAHWSLIILFPKYIFEREKAQTDMLKNSVGPGVAITDFNLTLPHYSLINSDRLTMETSTITKHYDQNQSKFYTSYKISRPSLPFQKLKVCIMFLSKFPYLSVASCRLTKK